MSQVFGLSEGNQDMLARLMGRDIRINRQFYRLPENVLEMVKVSKIVHLINTGSIATFKSKDFDEIQFDQNEQIDDSDSEENGKPDSGLESENKTLPPPEQKIKAAMTPQQLCSPNYHQQVKRRQGDTCRQVCSQEEKTALVRHFNKHIHMMKVPGKLDCVNAARAEKCFKKFEWEQIKYSIHNIIQANKRVK